MIGKDNESLSKEELCEVHGDEIGKNREEMEGCVRGGNDLSKVC